MKEYISMERIQIRKNLMMTMTMLQPGRKLNYHYLGSLCLIIRNSTKSQVSIIIFFLFVVNLNLNWTGDLLFIIRNSTKSQFNIFVLYLEFEFVLDLRSLFLRIRNSTKSQVNIFVLYIRNLNLYWT